MEVCALSLGSNVGDGRARLRAALRDLARLPRTRVLRVSPLLRSSPVGVRGQRDYLNCCALVRTGLSPAGLLVEAKRLEARAGRRPGPRWRPRALDIDVLFYGRRRLRGPWLEVPHPRALERRFVLEGLAALRPGWRPPVAPARTLRAWRARLNDSSQNVTVVKPPAR